jgi:hypothetical protein
VRDDVCRYLAFFPLFFGGIFLGTLVVVGQGSKEGAMQILTAVVLLSDVLFKVQHSRDLLHPCCKETHETHLSLGLSETDCDDKLVCI